MSQQSAGAVPEMVPEKSSVNGYVEDTIVIDWQTPAVFEKAKELVAGYDAEEGRIRAIFEFVRDEISHSFDVETDVVPCNASQVLREGTGLCFAKSHLLAALLRARGIPAGFCYQRLRSEPPAKGHSLHGFAAARIGDPGRWILLDARGNNDRVSTVFSLDEPSLAYLVDPDEGEETFPIIFTKPAKRIVGFLDSADSLARVRLRIPDRLD